MNKIIRYVLGTIILGTATSEICIAQIAPSLGTAAEYALFTSAGGFTNTGATTITGNIGNFTGGPATGTPATVVGSEHFGDEQSVLVAADVATAYAQLASTVTNPCVNTLSSPIGGVTLNAGVYCSTTESVLSGDLTLDGQGNSGATFIIKIDGALSVDPLANIILTGGTLLKNVYWQVNGAFNLAASTEFKGTLINAGAISLATGASISGRALSTAGLISLNTNNVTNAESPLPVTLVAFTAKNGENQNALLEWTTVSETNSDRFEIEHSTAGSVWVRIATVGAQVESRGKVSYSFSDSAPVEGSNLYRLKMIDKDETFAYSRIRNINIESGSETVFYPNPSFDKLTLKVSDMNKIKRVQFNDQSGKLLLDHNKVSVSTISSDFNIQNFPSGLYLVRVTHTNGSVDVVKIVKR